MRVTLLGTCLALLSLVAPLKGQQSRPALPEEVRSFLERDQAQRWATLIQSGDSLFNNSSCARCHGEQGAGGRFGPDLSDDEWAQSDGTLAGIREVIFWGVKREDFSDQTRRFQMNPAGGLHLEWSDYDALAAYVWSLSNGTFLPDRSRGGG